MNQGIEVGRYDRRVTFQYQPEIESGFNTPKKQAWTDIPVTPTVWASLENRTGSEGVPGDRVAYDQVAVIRIRYREDLNEEMSFLMKGVRYNITSIIEPKGFRKVKLDITAFQSE
jgi:SPP1 family predicted phage head-tail adaptor